MSSYITRKDREIIKIIETSINQVTGYDKDYYLDENNFKVKNRILRYSWVYEVYTRTMLEQIEISTMMNINQSNISRAIAAAKRWHGRNDNKYHQQFNKIHNEIERRILERSDLR
jgi:predicted XRE-type DNA-binding protein